jgi:hypothetical protein
MQHSYRGDWQLLDKLLRATQFGFRKDHSTSQPIHILRRIFETFERANSPVYALFLDWAKAFDSISPASMFYALERMGLPEEFIGAIKAIYSSPKFWVKDSNETSKEAAQRRGIRQGCPLSPYLFIICLSTMFHDVETTYNATFGETPRIWSHNTKIWELAYADDTVLLGRTIEIIQRFLSILENESALYGMSLNKSKCKPLAINRNYLTSQDNPTLNSPVTFIDGTQVPVISTKEKIEYLGVSLNTNASALTEINKRLSKAALIRKTLRTFFNHSDLTYKWRFQVYKSIFYALTLYGTESLWLTPKQVQRLDRFHFLNMRSIIGIDPVYLSRISHKQVLKEAENKGMTMGALSQVYISRRLKFLGHILRHTDSLEYNVTFTEAGNFRQLDYLVTPMREGKPKAHWAEMSMVQAKHRLHISQQSTVPKYTAYDHTYFMTPTMDETWDAMGGNINSFASHTASLFNSVYIAAQSRDDWRARVGR